MHKRGVAQGVTKGEHILQRVYRICRLRANCKSADMSKYKVKLHFYAVNACICTDETLFLLFQVKYVFLYIFIESLK